MAQDDLSDHPNVVSSNVMLQVARDGTTKSMLLVETDLALDAQSSDFDKKAVASLLDAVKACLAADPAIDSASIMPALEEAQDGEEDERAKPKAKKRRDDDEEEDEDDRPKAKKAKPAKEEEEDEDDDDDKPKAKKGKGDDDDDDDDDRKPARRR